ncbi:hypothetical protein [Citrobacter portucalensis]|uniref:hypothetical protein n=1 Tax=Citrobacter portucalensis TaxID=1639133 RepID=UPI0037540731
MAYLQITLNISNLNRPAAANVYQKFKAPFLNTIVGATSKKLLIRDEDVQVLHGFETTAQAQAYLTSELFTKDVVEELKPFLNQAPDIRIYDVI